MTVSSKRVEVAWSGVLLRLAALRGGYAEKRENDGHVILVGRRKKARLAGED